MELLGNIGSWGLVIAGVGLLVFIHESGHFFVAKWAGVRVLTFSLGFGPELFGFTRGDTRYRVSAVPLGGYVKMSGETELPEGGYAPDDYPAKPVWKRSLIILAGVVMNAVLAFLLFGLALSVGLKVPPVVIGTVRQEGAAWEAGLRRGDRILRADGTRLVNFADLQFATLPGKPVSLEVQRGDEVFTVRTEPRVARGERAPTIGVVPESGRRFKVAPGGAAEKAGFRDGDEVVASEGVPCTLTMLLAALRSEDVLASVLLPAAGPVHLTLRNGTEERIVLLPEDDAAFRIGIAPHRTVVSAVRGGGTAARAGWRPGDRPAAVDGKPVRGAVSFQRAVMRLPGGGPAIRVTRDGREVLLPFPGDPGERLEYLRDIRFADPDHTAEVEVLTEGPPATDGALHPSPAEAGGLPNGARILEVGKVPVKDIFEVRERIRASGPVALEFAWESGGARGTSVISPVKFPQYGFGKFGANDLELDGDVETVRVTAVGELVPLAFHRCVLTTKQIVATIGGIFRGSVAKENLGGPILIAQETRRGVKSGAGSFFWILAVLSVNLMFLNVLPIPLLDGGQLALLAFEAVTGKPPSEAAVGISQMVGLALLLGLMVMVTFNDVARLKP
jgi:regulator of sigma E protease